MAFIGNNMIPPTEDDFIAQTSVANLLRRAAQQSGAMAVPSEYANARPDILGMQTDGLLASMGRPHNPPNPGVPYAHTNYDGALPVAGRDYGLADITDWIKHKESSGNYTALNREQVGNTASGAYQYTDRTWNGYGGYAKAMLAPKEVQDRRFAEDIAARYKQYHGDPYKIIAAHFMPKYAGDPRTWNNNLATGGRTKRVADYVSYVVKGTPLQGKFNDYLARQ